MHIKRQIKKYNSPYRKWVCPSVYKCVCVRIHNFIVVASGPCGKW